MNKSRYKLPILRDLRLRTNLVHLDIDQIYTTSDMQIILEHKIDIVHYHSDLHFPPQEETLRLKRIAAASEKPHENPSYSSTTVTAVSQSLTHHISII